MKHREKKKPKTAHHARAIRVALQEIADDPRPDPPPPPQPILKSGWPIWPACATAPEALSMSYGGELVEATCPMSQTAHKPFQHMTPGEMAERNGVDLWRATGIVSYLRRRLHRVPSGVEVCEASGSPSDDSHPGYVHLVTALRSAQEAT